MRRNIPGLYERLTALMGKLEDHPLFAEMLRELGHLHGVHDDIAVRMHQFPELGFTIVFNAVYDCFSDVWFHIKTPAIESGNGAAYTGNFLNDIRPSDNRADVHRKMQGTPVCSGLSRGSAWTPDCNVDIYDAEPLKVNFDFDSRNDEMRSASIRLQGIENRHEAITKFLTLHPEFRHLD